MKVYIAHRLSTTKNTRESVSVDSANIVSEVIRESLKKEKVIKLELQ